MSDRLAVLADGLVEQVGKPETVYAQPASAYVAGFLGSANVIDVEVLGGAAAGTSVCRIGPHQLTVAGEHPAGSAKVVVRPERVHLGATDAEAPSGCSEFMGIVDRTVFLGPATHVMVRLADGQTLLVAVPNAAAGTSASFSPGEAVRAWIAPDGATVLPADTRPPPPADEDAARAEEPGD